MLGSNSNGTVPLVLDLEDSSGAEPVGHGTEGRTAHVEVRSLGLADPIGAGVCDGDRHWLAGAGSVAGALDLHIWNVANKKREVNTAYQRQNYGVSKCTYTDLVARATSFAVLEQGIAAGGNHRRERALADCALAARAATKAK
jgi:hypothetical protein